MNHSDRAQAVYDRADQLMRLCRALDYRAIAAHEPQAVAALQRAIEELQLPGWSGAAGRQTLLTPPASPAPVPEDRAAQLEWRRRCIEALGRAELGPRVGKVYYSNAAGRQVPFREAPHKRGLPVFDLVVGADFSPVEGYHGIFIGRADVSSCVLPLEGGCWQVRERVPCDGLARMVEVVSLLSAGFPV